MPDFYLPALSFFLFIMPSGNIYLIPVPIGNLGDITLRALELLKKAELIACEDTRVTAFLLQQYKIPVPKLISFHKFNEKQREEYFFEYLQTGKDLMIVSDAGSPAISDPAEHIVKEAIAKGIKVFALPGASAILPALSVSGFTTRQFQFVGFLPQQPKNRRENLEQIAEYPYTTVIYEAPHRIWKLLNELYAVCGNRKICICREISKLHEEHIHTTLEEINKNPSLTIKGEFCLILDGQKIKGEEEKEQEELNEDDLINYINSALALGFKTKDIRDMVCLKSSLSLKDAYQLVIRVKKEREK